MAPSITPVESSASDVAALVARVAELEQVQRAEDVEGFVALFDEDAVWVSAAGVRLVGRDAIAASTRALLPGAFSDGPVASVRYDVEHVRFITPDVALTGVDQEYLDLRGQPLSPPRRGRPSYLWRRRAGRWLIAAGQNTSVPGPAGDAASAALSTADAESLRQIVGDVESGFNANDPEPMVRHLAADALVVTALGVVLRGRDEIDRATRASLAAGPLRHASAYYRLGDITSLSPDVAVAHKEAWATPAAAESGKAPEMTALYVFARRGGRWWIVRRQNTLVHAET
jgi:uncharacterized protein (TIGR02246 family)